MLLPRLPILQQILMSLPAAGADYRAVENQIQRRLFAGVWYQGTRCRSAAEAERIVAQLNAL
jgi:hypothetical protein